MPSQKENSQKIIRPPRRPQFRPQCRPQFRPCLHFSCSSSSSSSMMEGYASAFYVPKKGLEKGLEKGLDPLSLLSEQRVSENNGKSTMSPTSVPADADVTVFSPSCGPTVLNFEIV